MSAAARRERVAEASPRFKARIAGVLYFLSLLTAIAGEQFLRGGFAFAAGLIAVAGMTGMTLLFYVIVRPVSRNLTLLATSLSLVGLTFEALRFQPRGVDIALVFHGLFCILIGCLILRSTFLPRILGALIAIAGSGWLTFLSPPLADHLSPYNLASGLLGEGSAFLWLLVKGVNVERWKDQASAAGFVTR